MGSGLKTLHFHCRGHGFGPWVGKIPHVTRNSHKKKSKIILFFIKDVRRCSEVIIASIWRPEVTTSLIWIPPSSLVSPGKRGHCRPTGWETWCSQPSEMEVRQRPLPSPYWAGAVNHRPQAPRAQGLWVPPSPITWFPEFGFQAGTLKRLAFAVWG